jgi:hypothetical protein
MIMVSLWSLLVVMGRLLDGLLSACSAGLLAQALHDLGDV